MIRLDYDEKFFLDKIRDYYRRYRPQENVLYVADCGGANGSYAEYVRQTFWDFLYRIRIFEPVPESVIQLRRKYDGAGGIEIERVAITGKRGRAKFSVRENAEHSQVVVARDYDGSTITVKTDTIDNLYAGYRRLHILKLDIEGEEVNALRGAKNLITDGAIDFIQFEYGGTWIARDEHLSDVGSLLPNWRVLQANTDALYSPYLHKSDLEDDYGMRNYLCVAPHITL